VELVALVMAALALLMALILFFLQSLAQAVALVDHTMLTQPTQVDQVVVEVVKQQLVTLAEQVRLHKALAAVVESTVQQQAAVALEP
jgi:hypothetical protein